LKKAINKSPSFQSNSAKSFTSSSKPTDQNQLVPSVTMHSYLALVVAFVASMAAAAPAGGPQSPPPQDYVQVILQGATPEDQRPIYVPTSSTKIPTYFGSSISHAITNAGPCTLFGVDNLELRIPSASTVDVGPPQTIEYIQCDKVYY
jgi:hypothetical protein